MNLEQAKQDTSAKLITLKEAFRYTECYLHEDLNFPEEPIRLMFGGWSEPESYKSEELQSGLADLLKNIEVIKIFATSEKDVNDMLAWILLELKIERFETNFIGNQIPREVDTTILQEIYNRQLLAFETCRKEVYEETLISIAALSTWKNFRID